MSTDRLDQVRGAVLDQIERSQRNIRLAFLGAVLLEAAFLGGFILLADLRDRLQLLLLVSTVAVYGILALGMLALASHVTRCTGRVLTAIDLTRKG